MPDETKDPLEELLAMKERYVEDGGFTQRVLDQLPPPRRRQRYKLPILLGLAMLGFIIAFVVFPGAEYVTQSVSQLAHYRPSYGEFPLAGLLIVAMIALGAALVAIWSEG
jgi:hypothetical protein